MTGAIAAITYGVGAAVTAQLHNQSVIVDPYPPPASVSAGYSIANDRNAKDLSGTTLEAWLSSDGIVGNYDVRVTPQSGASLTGTTATWLNCSSTNSWSITNTIKGTTLSSQFLVEIRLTATGIVQASATITLSATREGI